jgi:murein DD-endopeptidase MepM/ murein hydrolase activator NlpD
LHFVGLRIAIEARPELARALGGVLTQAEQDKIEASYKQRLRLIQEKLQATTDEIAQIQKLKDRFMEMATPTAVKSQIPTSGSGKGGPLKLPSLKNKAPVDLINALDESLQDINEFKHSVAEINALWTKQITWLNSLPIGTPINGNFSLTSGYGLRIDPFTQAMAKHEGLDFSAATGTPISASAGGVISRSGWDSQYGNVIEINHKKERMKERYLSYFKYSKADCNLTPADFHTLTYDLFLDFLSFTQVYEFSKIFRKDDFDNFWLTIQELKLILNEGFKSA